MVVRRIPHLALSLGELAERLGAGLRGDPNIIIERIAALATAGPRDVTFFSNRRYRTYLKDTRAGAVILAPRFASDCPVPALVLDNPYLGYARAAALLSPPPETAPGIAASAVIAPGARIAPDASVGGPLRGGKPARTSGRGPPWGRDRSSAGIRRSARGDGSQPGW